MNSDGFYPGREDSEEWVRLDSVENVGCSVPAVRVLADIKVDGAEDSTEGNPRDDTKSHVRRKYRMKRREGLPYGSTPTFVRPQGTSKGRTAARPP